METTETVRARAQDYFEGASPSHDWHHVQRVEQLAETLLTERNDANEQVLRLATLLHDIGRMREDQGKIDDHAVWGAKEADSILCEVGLNSTKIEQVHHCIRSHRYSNDVEPQTVEAELLCDADNLDALGAVGIARCFSFGGELGQALYNPEIPIETDETSSGQTQLNHFHKKIFSLPGRMYTEPGRRIAESRESVVKEFVERFKLEAAGEL
ncbi:HD domain-containing protein [Halococcus sp. IIIV-5B]|uniref:HD domain-containing protein n=1 Tax=Halococcus sp. IIIV-5B TaxID=2321230 RepID=UPI000E76B18A|nr:HD domain-containing protein [Halococcus sp. IIIV-5B]RJT07564.1 HD domain-containing protein [Halococcus sp. IIIV-5B]